MSQDIRIAEVSVPRQLKDSNYTFHFRPGADGKLTPSNVKSAPTGGVTVMYHPSHNVFTLSVCSINDRFKRKLGFQIAHGRYQKWSSTLGIRKSTKLPVPFDDMLERFTALRQNNEQWSGIIVGWQHKFSDDLKKDEPAILQAAEYIARCAYVGNNYLYKIRKPKLMKDVHELSSIVDGDLVESLRSVIDGSLEKSIMSPPVEIGPE